MENLIIHEYGCATKEINHLLLIICNATVFYDNKEYKGSIYIRQYKTFYTVSFDDQEFYLLSDYYGDIRKKATKHDKLITIIDEFIRKNREKIRVDCMI